MRPALILILLSALFGAVPAAAESVRSGELTLHYSALPSTTITPEVARASGVTRSASRALLNLSLRRASEDGLGVAVPGVFEVTARNELGQLQSIRVREVREATAIYYLGEARVDDGGVLDFEIEARVEGERPIRVRFSQQFFTAR